MKDTGIVRKLDDLGRFVIPRELRKKLGIENGDALEVFVQNDMICLKKYTSCCKHCKDNLKAAYCFNCGKKLG